MQKRNYIKNVYLKCADATRTKLKEQSFDYIIIGLVLHECSPELVKGMLHEAYRLLKDNGNLIVLEWEPPKKFHQIVKFFPLYLGERVNCKTFKQFYTADKELLFRKYGFITEQKECCNYSIVLNMKKEKNRSFSGSHIKKSKFERKNKMILTYREATKSDANLLIDIYNSSFYEDYIHYGECPGYGKTKEQMELSILKFPKYIIIKDSIPVGVISFENKGNRNYYLGCLCVIPMYQRMGIGSQAFQYMLSICPEWKQITLVTPSDKERNIKFYTEKCGFNTDGKEMDGSVEVTKFIMKR